MRRVSSLFVYLFFTLGIGEGRNIFLTPRTQHERKVVVVILPETGVDINLYKQFGETIQKNCRYQTWLVVADLHGKVARLEDIPAIVLNVRDRLLSEGYNTNTYSLFLGGHGASGFPVELYASFYPGEVDGILLLGSYLRQGPIVTFPVPALTLSGDLDGINRITQIADMMIENIMTDNQNEALLRRNPVIVIEGVNHGSIITGELPVKLKTLDVPNTIPRDITINRLALIVSSFLTKTVENDTSSETTLTTESQRTLNLLQPIMNIKKLTLDSTLKSTWVTYAQLWLSGIQGPDSAKIHVQSYVNKNFPEATLMEQLDGSVVIFTFSEMVFSEESDVTMEDMPPSFPQLLEIKSQLFNSERLQDIMRNSSVLGPTRSCRDLNYASFIFTYHTALDMTRKRFDETHSGILFHDDIVAMSKEEWEQRPLEVERRDRVLHVTSVSWSPVTSEGLVYCKLLPPPRIIEWIYIDSLL